MGLISGIIRLEILKNQQIDLEEKIQERTQTKSQLTTQGYELVNIGTDLDPESPEAKHLEQKRQKLELMEKQIDSDIRRYQNLLQMAEAEMQSAQKIVDNSIRRSFSYGGGQ